MAFPIFPKLWNGPTALGESRAQVQVPGLPYQTTFAGNAETRVSGDFIDVYQKVDTGLFMSWGDQFGSAAWRGLMDVVPNTWFSDEYQRNVVTTLKPTTKFTATRTTNVTLRHSDQVMRGPAGHLMNVSGGELFSETGDAIRIPTTDSTVNCALQTSRDGANFAALLQVPTTVDQYSTGVNWLTPSTFRTTPHSEFERRDRPWLFTRPFGANAAGWTVGLGWRDLVGSAGVAKYTFRDTDGTTKTSTILGDGSLNYSVPRITRVSPTALVALVARFNFTGIPWRHTLALVSTDNGRNWVDAGECEAFTAGSTEDVPTINVVGQRLQKFAVLPYSPTECWIYKPGEPAALMKVSLVSKTISSAAAPMLATTLNAELDANTASIYVLFDGDSRPTFAIRERFHTASSEFDNPTLPVRVLLTQDFVSVEEITLPWSSEQVGEPRWLNDTTILLPAYDATNDEHALYKSIDQFRTWTKIAVLWGDPANRADPPGRLAPPRVPKLNRFSTIEWVRDERGRPAAANPFSGRWICDDSAPPPEL